jgi:hypothetical protein
MKEFPFNSASFQAVATICLTLAISTTPMLYASNGDGNSTSGTNGNQNYGLPLGTLSATTPDPTLVNWPGEVKPHHQMLATQSYTAASSEWYPAGVKFDPHGSVGIRRFFQKRDPSNTVPSYVLEAASEIAVLTKDMPANSRFNQAQMNQSFGPYVPDLSTYTATTEAANAVYGVETVELVFIDASGNQTVLDYQKIDIYQPTITQTTDYVTQAAVNNTYSGDAPRVLFSVSSIYPGTETWVGIYPLNGNPQSAIKLANSDATSPQGDKSNRVFYVDPGNAISSNSGTYVLQLFENTPNGPQAIGQSTSFTLNTTFNVTSEFGITK